MCLDPITLPIATQAPSRSSCPAKALQPQERQQLAVQALARTHSISQLAEQHQVSRKFVHRQAATAEHALEQAFAPTLDGDDDEVLFCIPVTKSWLRQAALGLILICHSSYRGVIEFFRDLFNFPIAIGTVHNIVAEAIGKARVYNRRRFLDRVRIGAHDEIFQARLAVLVGVDVQSTYCYLLAPAEQRDAETWALHLLELKDLGFAPDRTIGDFGTGLRAGQQQAFPGLPCDGDVFHALQEFMKDAIYLENRAFDAMNACVKLELRQARVARNARFDKKLASQLTQTRRAQDKAIALADDVATLGSWLRRDILSLAGPVHAERIALYDFLVAELQARAPQCAHRLNKLVTFLKNQRDDLLAFSAQLDSDLTQVANAFEVAPHLVRELLAVHTIDPDSPRRYYREAPLRQQLGEQYFLLSEAVEAIAAWTVRASSVVENLNSRLRCYFFLRRHVGPDYLELLQFFLNHRRFLRSEHPERVDKSPAELLTGAEHPPWQEMLGYRRFSRN